MRGCRGAGVQGCKAMVGVRVHSLSCVVDTYIHRFKKKASGAEGRVCRSSFGFCESWVEDWILGGLPVGANWQPNIISRLPEPGQ
jgi:hypothetical protein